MKYKKKLVSVILNCYNGSKYLREALISVQNQSFKNWELIFGIIDLQITANKFYYLLKTKILSIIYLKNIPACMLLEI